MAKEELVKTTGKVVEALGNASFRVQLEGQADPVFCTISGKIRKNKIIITVGDTVEVELSPYDLTRGRISYLLTNRKKRA